MLMYNSSSRRCRSNKCTCSLHKQCGATTLARARQHHEARQGCPIWALRCMWDRRHGHVPCVHHLFPRRPPDVQRPAPPAGKPELTNFSSFACSPLAEPPLLKETIRPSQLAPHRARFARRLGVGLTGATDCGLQSESRAQNGHIWPYFLLSRASIARI